MLLLRYLRPMGVFGALELAWSFVKIYLGMLQWICILPIGIIFLQRVDNLWILYCKLLKSSHEEKEIPRKKVRVLQIRTCCGIK